MSALIEYANAASNQPIEGSSYSLVVMLIIFLLIFYFTISIGVYG